MQKRCCYGTFHGWILALKLAVERRAAGIISLATPIFLTSRKSALAVILQYFIIHSQEAQNKSPRY